MKRLRAWGRAALAWCVRERVLNDLAILGGFGLIGWGGWQLSPAWTGVALGSIFVILGMLPIVRSRKGPG